MTGSADRRRYRRLLRVLPSRFRDRYGDEMEETFVVLMAAARRRGAGAVTVLWVAATWDALRLAARVRSGSTARGGRGAGGGPFGRGTTRGRGGDMMGALGSDLRFAVRALARRPALLVTAVVTLALGIGANTAVFSVVNGLLIRPFPYPEADELVVLYSEHRELGWSGTDVNMADAWDWRARAGVFEDVAVWDEPELNVTGGDRPELVSAIRGTTNVLSTLGVEPLLGRDFTPDDGTPGAPLAVILTHGYWQRSFGGDPGVLGATVALDDEPATIVGVMPPDFVFLDERKDLVVPFRLDPAGQARGSHDSEAVARLREGVGLDEARLAVNDVARQLEVEHPEQNDGWTVQVVSLRQDMLGDMARRASLVMMVAVVFILVMACTNVANLLLARADGRRGEIAVRTALGAGRGRIVGQLAVESLLLAGIGGAAGVVLAYWGERAMVAGLPENMPPVFTFGLDGTVLAFALAVSLGSALLFGLVPALRASRPAASELPGGGRAGVARGRRRFGSILVVVQTALAVVLLVAGGVLVRSVVGMARQDMGFDPEGVLTVHVSPPESRYPDPEALDAFFGQVLARVRGLPGVEAAGAVQSLPLGGSNWGTTVWFEGREDPESDRGRSSRLDFITPGYLEAMGIDVVRGRGVVASDGRDAPLVALVSERFALRYLPDGPAVGRRLVVAAAPAPVTVVGVVEDHLERGIDDAPEATVFLPLAQGYPRGRALVVRTDGEPTALIDAVQQAVWDVDPDQPVFEVRTMDEWVTYRVGGFRLIAQTMGTFAVVALLLGAVGIYGVTSYAVGRRTREIGVRMAVGADRGGVVRMVVREGMLGTLLGLASGLLLALVSTRALAGILVGVGPRDPLTFGAVTVVLVAVGFLGTWLPARRAARVDPVRVLARG